MQRNFSTMSTASKKPNDAGGFHRAMRVLDAVAFSEQGLRFAELEKQLEYPKATLNRLLNQLLDERLIRLDDRSQAYSTGFRLLELARQSWDRMDLRRLAHDKLEDLCAATNESVQLAVLDDTEMVYVDSVECTQNVRLSVRVGDRIPIYCSGTGKAVLAWTNEEERNSIIDRIRFAAITTSTITDKDSLQEELSDIRLKGFAIDKEEHFVGVYCLASPILNANGVPVAAVSVGAPNFRIESDTLDNWSCLIKDAAFDIAARLPPFYQ